MIDIVENIIATELREVLNSSLSLQLLKCYSKLYLNGAMPRACSRSQTNYYNQLKIDGLKRAKEMEEILNRTCALNEGICIYVKSLGMHLSNVNITDAIALKGIKEGFIKLSQFKRLPVNYVNSEAEIETTLQVETSNKIENEINNKGRKQKIKRKAK